MHVFIHSLTSKPMPIAALLIVTLLGGGTSVAAESSLPGDILYPVKIHVNETLRQTISFSPEAKAGWDARRAERRLEEAVELALRGSAKPETATRLAETFVMHTDQVEKRIKELEAKNTPAAAELATRFEASLKAHEKILAAAATTPEGDDPVRVALKKKLVAAELNRIEAEASTAAEAAIKKSDQGFRHAVEGKLKSAIGTISAARSFLEVRKAKLDPAVLAQAEARLVAANATIAEAKKLLDEDRPGEALSAISRALVAADEARLIAQTEYRCQNRPDEYRCPNRPDWSGIEAPDEKSVKAALPLILKPEKKELPTAKKIEKKEEAPGKKEPPKPASEKPAEPKPAPTSSGVSTTDAKSRDAAQYAFSVAGTALREAEVLLILERGKLPKDTVARAEAQLAATRSVFAEARTAFFVPHYEEALALAEKAEAMANTVREILTAAPLKP